MAEISRTPIHLSIPDLLIRNHPVIPAPIGPLGPSYDARLTVIGIGTDGAKMANLLSKNQSGIECYEIHLDRVSDANSQPSTLYSSIMHSDLAFLMYSHKEVENQWALQSICDLAREYSIPIIGIQTSDLASAAFSECADWNFMVSAESIADTKVSRTTKMGRKALTSYAGRHIVHIITDLILQRSLICVDLVDVQSVLGCGKIGLLGAGVASGCEAGRLATAQALYRISAQGFRPEMAMGALFVMEGSSLMTMENFDAMCITASEILPNETNIVCGLTQNDVLGYNMKVSILITF